MTANPCIGAHGDSRARHPFFPPSQAALPSGPRLVPGAPPVGGLRLEAVMEALQRQQAARLAQGMAPPDPPRLLHLPQPHQPPLHGPRSLAVPEGALGEVGTEEEEDAQEDEEEEEEGGAEEDAAQESHAGPQGPSSPSNQPLGPQPHEWTYEEQFKQVGPLHVRPPTSVSGQ